MIDNRYRAAELDGQTIAKFLKEHIEKESPRLKAIFDVYDGVRGVDKGKVVEGRPNNEVKAEWASYMADMITNYAVGIPIKYHFNGGKEEQSRIDDVLANNNEDIVNFELVDDLNIYGKAYEFDFMDEGGHFQFANSCPLNTFVIYDKSIKPRQIGAVYYEYDIDNGIAAGTFFDRRTKRDFTFAVQSEGIDWTTPMPHKINGVPITEVYANKYATSCFAKVLPLIDAYNVTLSNNTDDLQGVANAILHIEGAGDLSEEDIDNINRYRVSGYAGQMSYVTKDLNADVLQTHKDSLRTDMLSIAKTPNLTDEQFAGNLSGVAIRFKLWGIDQIRLTLIRYLTPLLYRRFMRIIEAGSTRESSLAEVTKLIDISFTPNMPTNDLETVQMAAMLFDRISLKSFLNMLPDWIVADVEAEILELHNEYGEEDTPLKGTEETADPGGADDEEQ